MIFLDGCITSCGVLLVVAGAGKAYACARRRDSGTAIRRALRIQPSTWRVVELVTAGVECSVGAIVCAGVYPMLGGAVMATLGTTFSALLGYVRLRRVPGGCGCVGWGKDHTVTVRSIGRAGLLVCAGLAESIAPQRAPDALAQPWFYAGIALGSAILIALSTDAGMRTPVCRRPLWRPVATTARALARSGVFQAMFAAAGPFAAAAYQRNGCVDEYWFIPAGDAGRSVVFRVSHRSRQEPLAVQATLADAIPPAGAQQVRAIGGHAQRSA